MLHNDSIDHMLENDRHINNYRSDQSRNRSPESLPPNNNAYSNYASSRSKYSDTQWNRLRFLFNKPVEEFDIHNDEDQAKLNNHATSNKARMLLHNDKFNNVGFLADLGLNKKLNNQEFDPNDLSFNPKNYNNRYVYNKTANGNNVHDYLKANLVSNPQKERISKKKRGIDYGFLISNGGIQKESPLMMLNKMKQEEFLEVFYANFVVNEDVRFNSIESKEREKVVQKRLMSLIAKRRSEIQRFQDVIDNVRSQEDEKRDARNKLTINGKSLWHLRQQVSTILEKIKLNPDKLGEFLAFDAKEDVLERIDYDIREYEKYMKIQKQNSAKARKLLQIDQVESRAVYNRLAINSIADQLQLKSDAGQKDKESSRKFRDLITLCLLTKNRVDSFFDAIEQIESFEDKYYLLAMKTIGDRNQAAPLNLNNNGEAVKIYEPKDLEIDEEPEKNPKETENNIDHAYLFLPFWDCKMDDALDENSIQLRKQLSVTKNDASAIRIVSNCQSIRAFIAHLRSNTDGKGQKRVFTPKEIMMLESKGVKEPTHKNFQRSIIFLSVQSKFFPNHVFEFINKNYKIRKLDMSNWVGIKANALGACLSCIVRHNHPVSRLNVGEQKLEEDAAHILSMFIPNTDIEELNLKGNCFTVKGNQVIYGSLKASSSIKILNYSNNNQTNEAALKIGNLLKLQSHSPINISVLNLSHNSFSDHAVNALLDYAIGNKNLNYLGLNNVLATEKISTNLIKLLSDRESNLFCLELEYNFFTDQLIDEMIHSLSHGYVPNKSQKVLKLGSFKTIQSNLLPKFLSLFAIFKRLLIGSASVRSQLENTSKSFLQINEANRSLLRVDVNPQRCIKEAKTQMSFYEIFTEIALFDQKNPEELVNIHKEYLDENVLNNKLEMDWRIRKIWNKMKPQNSKVEHTKETVVIEYLLYYILNGEDINDYFEYLYFLITTLQDSKRPLSDGEYVIHKQIRHKKHNLLTQYCKLGFVIDVLSTKNSYGLAKMAPLHMVVILQDFAMIDTLQTYKAKIDIEDEFKNTVQHYATSLGNLDLMSELLSKNSYLHNINAEGLEPQQIAVYNDDLKSFQFLLDKAGSTRLQSDIVLKKAKNGKNCIHYAVQFNALEIFKLIVDITKVLDEGDNDMRTPQMYSILWERGQFVDLLLKNGSDVNLVDINNTNVLMFAARKNNISLFNQQLKYCNIDTIFQTNDKGDNLQHVSIISKAYEVFKRILDLEIDVYQKNKSGVMPYELIMSNKNAKIIYETFVQMKDKKKFSYN